MNGTRKHMGQIVQQNKIQRRWLSLTLVLCMLISFFTPLWSIVPAIALADEAFTEVQNTKPSGAVALPDDLIVDFSKSNLVYNEDGSADFKLTLKYEEMSGVNEDQPYIYYQLPPNIKVVEGGFYGDDKTLFDTNEENKEWIDWVDAGHDETAAYYSISESGLIVIRFTQNYILHGIGNDTSRQFDGSINFSASASRAETASGDQEFNINNLGFTIEFPDMLGSNSKRGNIDTSGDKLKIHYVITIDNPYKQMDLTDYVLEDTMFRYDIQNITSDPDVNGTLDQSTGRYTFGTNPDEETVKIEYDYYPTTEELDNFDGLVKNTATLVNKDSSKPNDKSETTAETPVPTTYYKSSVKKIGKPAYDTSDTLGIINWSIEVSKPNGFTLENYNIVDAAFSSETKENLKLKVTDSEGKVLAEDTDYSFDQTNGKITITSAVSGVKIEYQTTKDDDGNPLHTDGSENQGVSVNNTVNVNPPGNPGSPESTDSTKVTYSEKSSVTKKGVTSSDKLTLNASLGSCPDSLVELDWEVTISDFEKYTGTNKYIDELKDGQYLTQSQFDNIKISDKDGELSSDKYTIAVLARDANDNITKFSVDLKGSEYNLSRTQTITYSSTAIASGIENGQSKDFNNTGEYGDPDNTTTIKQTVYRNNISGNEGIMGTKTWVDAPTDQNKAYLLLQYSTDQKNWYAYKAGGIYNNPKEINGDGKGEWWNLPLNDPQTDTPLYYRVIEVENANDLVDGDPSYTPTNYTVSYDKDGVAVAENPQHNFDIVNTYNKMSINVNKNWVGYAADKARPPVTFKLYRTIKENPQPSDWGEPFKSIDLGDASGVVFSELDKRDKDGNLYYYKVEEVSISDFETTMSSDGIFSDGNGSLTVTNKYEKVDVKAIKEWTNDSADAYDRVPVTVHLEVSLDGNDSSGWHKYGDPDDNTAKDILGDYSGPASITITEGDKWNKKWTDLPRYTSDGKAIYYRVVEDGDIDHYKKINDGISAAVTGGTSATEGAGELICSVTNEWELINIYPVKTWYGDQEHKDCRPAEGVQMQLMVRHMSADGEWYEEDGPVPAGKDIIPIENNPNDNTWKTDKGWTHLPKTEVIESVTYTCYYSVVEVNADSMEAYISKPDAPKNAGGSMYVSNTYNYIDITPQKVWKGDEECTDERKAVEFKLEWWDYDEEEWVSNETRYPNISISDPLTGGNTWTATKKWEKLLKIDAKGREIKYRIVEVTDFDNYIKQESPETTKEGTLSFTNTYNRINIKAKKYWEGDLAHEREGLTVTFKLEYSTDNGASWSTYSAQGVKNPVSVAAVSEGSNRTQESDLWVWKKLPKVIDDNPVIYRITETPVKNYGASYSDAWLDNSGTITVTNTKFPAIDKEALRPKVPEKKQEYNDEGGLFEPNFDVLSKLKVDDLSKVPVETLNGEKVYVFPWKVTANNVKNVDYVDILPDDSVLYMNKVNGVENKNYPIMIHYTNSNHNYYSNGSLYVTYPYEDDIHRARFNINENGALVDYFIYYVAIPKDKIDAEVREKGGYLLTNKIVHTGTDVGDTATMKIGNINTANEDTLINKKYRFLETNNQNAQPKYNIEINPHALDLSSDDYLNITDVFEVTGYNGSQRSGLLDAIISNVSVVDLDKVNSKGVYEQVKDFSYITEVVRVVDEYKTIPLTDINGTVQIGFGTNSGTYQSFYINNLDIEGVKPNDDLMLTLKIAEEKIVDLSKYSITVTELSGMQKTYKLSDFLGQETAEFNAENKKTVKFKIVVPDEGIKSIVFGDNTDFTITDFYAEHGIPSYKNYIHLQVPDGKHLRISYYYNLKTNDMTPADATGGKLPLGQKPPVGTYIEFSNGALMETSNGTEISDAEDESIMVSASNGDVTSSTPPSLVKVNIGNQSITNINATFKLAVYDTSTNKWTYATNFEKTKNAGDTITFGTGSDAALETVSAEGAVYVPMDKAADLEINGKHPLNLTEGKLYKIVETVAPDGYSPTPYQKSPGAQIDINSNEMKNYVFYFIYAGGITDDLKAAANNSSITLINKHGSANVPNSAQIDIGVEKTWNLKPEDEEKPWSAKFKLYYYTGARSSTIPDIPTDPNDPNAKMHPAGQLIDPLTGNPYVTDDEVTISSDSDDLSYIWRDLPNGYNGQPIFYYVVETSYELDGVVYERQNDGKYVSKDDGTIGTYGSIYSNNGLNKTGEVSFVNGEGITVKKVWRNADNSEMTNPPLDSISFHLQGKTSVDGDWIEIDEWTITDDTWEITIPNDSLMDYVDLQVVESDGTIAELKAIDGSYTVSYNKNIVSGSGQFEITNKKSVADEISVIVSKEWNDGLSVHDNEVTVDLYQATKQWANSSAPTDDEIKAAGDPIDTFTLSKDNKWTYTKDHLKNFQDNGEKYYYYVIERKVDGYTTRYDYVPSSMQSLITITNTPDATPGKLSVSKQWTRVAEGDIPESITLELYRRAKPVIGKSDVLVDSNGCPEDIESNAQYELVNNNIPLNDSNNWSVVLNDLEEKITVDGKEYEYIYYFREKDSSTKWVASYTHNGQPANGQMNITVTNTGDAQPEKTSLSVKKEWKGVAEKDIPESVTLLLQELNIYGDWETIETVTLSAAEKWVKTFDNLEVGSSYRFEEVNLPKGWVTSYSANNGEELEKTTGTPPQVVVTNTWNGPKTAIKINKVWSDNVTNSSDYKVFVKLWRDVREKAEDERTDTNLILELSSYKTSVGKNRINESITANKAVTVTMNTKPAVATAEVIGADGKTIHIEGLSAGSTTITVSDGFDTKTIEVIVSPLSINIDPTVDLVVGKLIPIQIFENDTDVTDDPDLKITWPTGVTYYPAEKAIIVEKPGDITIKAQKGDYNTDSTLTIGIPEFVFTAKPTGDVIVGNDYTVTIAPKDAPDKPGNYSYGTIKWEGTNATLKSSNGLTATFASSATGTATITAKDSKGNVICSTDVNIIEDPKIFVGPDVTNLVMSDDPKNIASVEIEFIDLIGWGSINIQLGEENYQNLQLNLSPTGFNESNLSGSNDYVKYEIDGKKLTLTVTGNLANLILLYKQKGVTFTYKINKKPAPAPAPKRISAPSAVNSNVTASAPRFSQGIGISLSGVNNNMDDIQAAPSTSVIFLQRKAAPRILEPTFDDNGFIIIELNAENNFEKIKNDLEITDPNGNEYYYWVEEVSVKNSLDNDVKEQFNISYKFEDADSSTTYSINAAKKGNATATIKNIQDQDVPVELPETGGEGTKPYTAVGMAIMMLSGTTLYFKRRSRRERKNA